MPAGGLGILQTYRGCPFTCSFCEWGTMESPKRVRTADSLRAEFGAMDRLGLGAALLADAGLNLNQPAFQNFQRAAQETGFLAKRGLICEVYPAKVRREHLDFLAGSATLMSVSACNPSTTRFWPMSSANTTKRGSRKRCGARRSVDARGRNHRRTARGHA